MKTLLSLMLILLAMVCLGQNYNRSTKERIKSDSIMKIEIRNDSIFDSKGYKCSKCGGTIFNYKGLTKSIPKMLIYECVKCHNIEKAFPGKINVSDEQMKINNPDSSYWYGKQIAYRNYEGSTYTFKPGKTIKAKLSLSSTGMVTINIDEFKVTDTIWIQSGKRKVGVPAYKFLDYFKDEPTITNPWRGNDLYIDRGILNVGDTTRIIKRW